MSVIIERVILKKDYRYLWLMQITGVDLSQHCLKCFKGIRDFRVKNEMRSIESLTLNRAPFYYLCGVERNFTWKDNVHLAFREKEGNDIVIDNELFYAHVKNAEELPVNQDSIDWTLPQSKDRAFNLCRNWQFANWLKKNELVPEVDEIKIYTSYFGNAKRLNAEGIKIINVARFPPRWVKTVSLHNVAPSSELIRVEDPEEYTRRYKEEVLDRISAKDVIKEIKELAKGQDVALCCFETPGKLCHRHMLADFLNSNGCNIREFGQQEELQFSFNFN